MAGDAVTGTPVFDDATTTDALSLDRLGLLRGNALSDLIGLFPLALF